MTVAKVTTAEELAQALKQGVDTIEIEGDLSRETIRIRATGYVAWGVCIGAIGIAVAALLLAPASGGTTGVVSMAVAPAAVGILGVGATTTAISIAVAAGGIGVLSKVREYKEIYRSDNKLVLKKV